MLTETSLRRVLLAAALFNFGAALAFTLPTTLGAVAELPAAPPLYTTLVALFVLLFGGSYLWLALQPVISRPLLALGAIGKTTAAVAFTLLWLCGEASLLLMLGGLGDLAFAVVFFVWLRSTASNA